MRMRSAVLALLVPSVLLSQREPLRQPTSVPLDLAVALASSGGLGAGTDPQILVGELPEWMATNIHIPSSALILGAASMGTTTLGFLQLPQGDDSPFGELETELPKKGWKKADWMSPAGGFRLEQSATPEPNAPNIYCSSDRVLYITPGAARQGKQTWVFRLSAQVRNYSPCSAPDRNRSSPYPLLYHPRQVTRVQPSARMGPNCSNVDRWSLGGGGGTGDRISTVVNGDSLLAHYGRQLADSGWIEAPGTTFTQARSWIRTGPEGRKELLQISVGTATDNPGCRDVNLMLWGRER